MRALQQNGSEKIVFLGNVSIITLDLERNRIVFNFMNNIHMFGRWTPDYHYFTFDTSQEAEEKFKKLKELPFLRINFFISNDPRNINLVNKKAVTTLTEKDEELKIIFNLNFAITSYRGDDPIEISKFVFWNYDDIDAYDDDRMEIVNLISGIETL